uniref:Uncharacterized protein n=1 Tax=Erythrolobus madagascarensis TaxID=708628 RepID=A0A7S0T885_9RHOD
MAHAGVSLHIRKLHEKNESSSFNNISSNNNDHSEVPDLSAFVQYYEGVEGFCGWHAENNPLKPWQLGKGMVVEHVVLKAGDVNEADSSAAISRAVGCTAVASCASVLSACYQRLTLGGYGANGVCLDSVAVIQAALDPTRRTTLYPILLFGAGRQELARSCAALINAVQKSSSSFAESCGVGGQRVARNAATVLDAIWKLPCDVAPSLDDLDDVCARMLASLPTMSPFALTSRTISDAKRVQALHVQLQSARTAPQNNT